MQETLMNDKNSKCTYMLCSIALRICCIKASLVGGMFSTVLAFLVSNSLLQLLMSFAELVKSYIKITNRSITQRSSSFNISCSESILEIWEEIL